ncbi:MAG: alpha/beta hydrolase [Thermoguttaceae bacterium]|nr:alpha/beta hydrolase [Thermoguttaceae bacterium]MBR5758561.1 alpha/beta hydrolase [Thermoguttaceae bacterium]
MTFVHAFKKIVYSVLLSFLIGGFSVCAAQEPSEKIDLWEGLAPGESVREANVESQPGYADKVTVPQLLIFRPENQTSDTCMLLLPGGGFNNCYYGPEGIFNARYWNSKGRFAAVLVYRVPRPKDKPIYWLAFQDAQRAVRYLRANADKYGIDPNKIGVQGYSAGGCLALYVALNSETQSYEPEDDLDKLPANVAFALPVYPAFVLDDGEEGPNVNGGEGAALLDDFHFDAHTPPMCIMHGDSDIYSPLGSVEIYKKLRKMNVSCELHIYAGAVHGFYNWLPLENAGSWRERSEAWLIKTGF